ncbi:HotDog domain-containing protein [Annulohypoxylon truncatum]|uniref:HotDog domain-containing protein n=1 Tax=Annulohypoxylon truncatum TaxID=327061 RepID=UPI002007E0F1|nr:HotDog domain-containing protein [Annulohypoxylon truncatum]KAI1212725.1 HotDog domain-containing protein [Annulohypoxylon truncatum]
MLAGVGGPRAAQACLRSVPLTIPLRSRLLPAHPNPAIRIPRASLPPSQLRPFTSSRLLSADRTTPSSRTPDAILRPEPGPSSSSSSSSSASPPPRRKRLRPWLFIALGFGLGTMLRLTLSPPTPPAPGSDEDTYLSEQIRAQGSSLPLVQKLSTDPRYTSWDAYSGFSSPTTHTSKPHGGGSVVQSRITTGPLAGSRGLPFQRIYHDVATGEVVSVVYFGSGTGGWPGVVHGGALATLLDESLGRCAILRFPARTGVTARLELQYRQPTLTSGFYVIRARPMPDERDGPEKQARKLWVEGTLETVDGKTCVEAKALFVVPKGVKLKPLVEGF